MGLNFYLVWFLVGLPIAVKIVIEICKRHPAKSEDDYFAIGLCTMIISFIWPLGIIYLVSVAIGTFVSGRANIGKGCG